MTKKTATMTAMLAAIGLAAVALPATAQEPQGEVSPSAACVEHDETSMPPDAMDEWMGEMGVEMTARGHDQIHDDMHNMMAMMHGAGDAHEMGEGSMLGPRSMMSSDHMGAGSMMGGSAMNPGSTMGGGS